MAWTKMKTAVVVGAVAILAATSTTIIGIKMAHTQHEKAGPMVSLSPSMMNGVVDMQPDGTSLFQMTVEETNGTSQIIRTETDNDPNETFTRVTDNLGQPMKFVKQGGHYLMTFNKPVPPEGAVTYTIEGNITADELKAEGTIKSIGPNEYEFALNGGPSGDRDIHYVVVWRLPTGTTLLGKSRGLEETNNAGRIELRVDTIIPPNGNLSYSFRYRLPANATTFQQESAQLVSEVKMATLACFLFSGEHTNQLPASFAQLNAWQHQTSLSDADWEFVAKGDKDNFTNPDATIYILEKKPRQSPDGTFVKVYATVNGRVFLVTSPDEDFTAVERQRGFLIQPEKN